MICTRACLHVRHYELRVPIGSQPTVCGDLFLEDKMQIYKVQYWTVARKLSIGGLCVGTRGGSLDIIKLTKILLIYSVSLLNLGGLGTLFGGTKATKDPRGDGDWSNNSISSNIWCAVGIFGYTRQVSNAWKKGYFSKNLTAMSSQSYWKTICTQLQLAWSDIDERKGYRFERCSATRWTDAEFVTQLPTLINK